MKDKTNLHMRCSVPQDLPVLRQLWAEAFQESDCFDLFIRHLYRPEDTLLTVCQEQPVSVVYLYENEALLLPCTDLRKQVLRFSCPCFYAFSTTKAFRGQHIGLNLLQAALNSCDRKKTPFTMISPADEGLHALYCNVFGFQPFFEVRKLIYQNNASVSLPAGAAVSPLSVLEYGKQRERFLSGIPHLVHSPAQLEYQEGLCRLCNSGFYMLQLGTHSAITAMEQLSDTKLYCMELLAEDAFLPEFIRLLFHFFPCEQITVRMPVEFGRAYGGSIHSLALLRRNPLFPDEVSLPDHSYAGFIFD